MGHPKAQPELEMGGLKWRPRKLYVLPISGHKHRKMCYDCTCRAVSRWPTDATKTEM